MVAVQDITAEDAAALQRPYAKSLILLMRAQDTHGAWERKNDAQLLAEFIVTKEQRREIPIIGDPDPDVLWRIEQFYTAVGLAVEKQTGVMAGPMMKMSHEGFGRLVLIAGKLIALSRHLRDVHRFGFESLAKLVAEGEKYVAQAVAEIEAHPEVANP
ncbi:NifX-associated nitrogen fixation protein [Rhodoblastus sp.]|uniref:NifX-associated nitrogen fixation protein n=1 Tax=Rhodoblastus sp. TaxID=1962975 RepID=UPI003F99129F